MGIWLGNMSRCKQHPLPGTVYPYIAHPEVKPVESAFPEFHFIRNQGVPAPGVRTGNGLALEPAFALIDLFNERFSTLDDAALGEGR